MRLPPFLCFGVEHMIEKWLPVPGYETEYAVSNMGRVRRLDHFVFTHTKKYRTKVTIFLEGKILRPGIASNGYLTVSLKRRTYCVHVLVMCAFKGECPEGYEVAHNDGDKLNCKLGNLRYATRSDNNKDKTTHGTGTRIPLDIVQKARESTEPSERLAKVLGVSGGWIRKVRNGRLRSNGA